MKHNADNTGNNITLLPSLLKVLAMFDMPLWYDNENLEENVVCNIGIKCRNCEKKLVDM